MKQRIYSLYIFVLLTTILLSPLSAIAKTNMGTIYMEVGESRQLTSEPSTYYTVSGEWYKTGSAVSISSSSSRSCTITAIQEGTATVEWRGLINTTWEEMYWTVYVTPNTDIQINSTNFPDQNFRNFLLQQSYGYDGKLTKSEINGITELRIQNKDIASLKGIEYFTALTKLFCNNNQLTSLDVFNNTALKLLSCQDNKLTSINLHNNIALEDLYCEDNQLTSIFLPNSTSLKTIECQNNKLTSLDVTKNTALASLRLFENQVTSLDLSKNTSLETLHCSNNQLTSVFLPNSNALKYLYCWTNKLTSLDVSKNTSLLELECGSNQLVSLDVTKNTALTKLSCVSNQLTTLDLKKNTALTSISCSSNQLTTLDVTKNTALASLYCDYNIISSLLISQNTSSLKWISCEMNQILGAAMDDLITNLPQNTSSEIRKFQVIDTRYLDFRFQNKELNVCSTSQIDAVKAKGWKPVNQNEVELEVITATDITLDKTSLSIKVGKTGYLYPTIKPNNATYKQVAWESSNPNVATVESHIGYGNVSGIVEAHSEGTATITCKTLDGSGKLTTCAVTVTPADILVTGITLNKNSLSLETGQSETLEATVKPDNATNKTVTWSSSNSSIATVDSNGKVTAKSKGNTTITCKANDESGVQATCSIAVTDPFIPINSITLNKTSLSIEVGKAETLEATVKPDNATNKTVTWSSETESVATIDSNGKVTAKAKGNTTITCKANDGSGVQATCIVTVNNPKPTAVTLPDTASVVKGETLTLTPELSPTNAETTLTWTSDDETVATVNSEGVVQGVGIGQTYINVETDNGKMAWCKLTVVAPEPTKIELPKNASVYIGETIALTPTFTPADAISTLTWQSDDERIAKVSADGVVTGIAEGLTVITATSANGITSNPCKVKVMPDPSGVNDVTVSGRAGNIPVYSVSGQRIVAPRKGVNIVNGKKVVVR